MLCDALFILLINDMLEKISSTARLFADDCLESNNQQCENAEEFQNALDTHHRWD